MSRKNQITRNVQVTYHHTKSIKMDSSNKKIMMNHRSRSSKLMCHTKNSSNKLKSIVSTFATSDTTSIITDNSKDLKLTINLKQLSEENVYINDDEKKKNVDDCSKSLLRNSLIPNFSTTVTNNNHTKNLKSTNLTATHITKHHKHLTTSKNIQTLSFYQQQPSRMCTRSMTKAKLFQKQQQQMSESSNQTKNKNSEQEQNNEKLTKQKFKSSFKIKLKKAKTAIDHQHSSWTPRCDVNSNGKSVVFVRTKQMMPIRGKANHYPHHNRCELLSPPSFGPHRYYRHHQQIRTINNRLSKCLQTKHSFSDDDHDNKYNRSDQFKRSNHDNNKKMEQPIEKIVRSGDIKISVRQNNNNKGNRKCK